MRDQESSELTVRAFCAREGVAESAFYFWRRELERRQAERGPPRLAPGLEDRAAADRRRASPAAAPRFVPVVIAEPTEPARTDSASMSPSLVELVHPGGIVVRVPGRCDVVVLRSILDLLDARAAEARSC